MPFFRYFPVCLHFGAIAALLVLGTGVGWSKGPEPPLRVPLLPLGFQPPPAGADALPGAGAFTTVNFIDEQHLLVTFGVRRLMKRMADCPPDDNDRTVEAVVVHLPTGKVMARTQWRMHDASTYLWSLGHGRFLLRVRDTLTTFAPLVNLPSGDPFVEQPFLKSSRRIEAVLLSPDKDLVTIETTDRGFAGDASVTRRPSTQINFYRLLEPPQSGEKVIVQAAGMALAEGLVSLPVTAAGYIEVLQESPARWLFDFEAYAGKYKELSPFDSTCRPRPVFVTGSEFVAFGCRGSDDRLEFGGFNMRGEQMWQQDFPDLHAFPNFAISPEAGRFALSRNIVAATAGITVDTALTNFTTQEIRVYQMESGKQLLRVQASPIQRQGGNYDLSPDGLKLAVIHDEVIEVDRLPSPSEADRKALRAAQAERPEDAMGFVSLTPHGKRSKAAPPTVSDAHADMPSASAASVPEPAISAPPTSTAAEPLPSQQVQNGDAVEQGPRKAPSLYTLPGEKVPEKPQ